MKKLLILTIICLTGCTGYQYVAPPNYVPVNTEKNSFTGNISIDNKAIFSAANVFNSNSSSKSYAVGYSISNSISIFSTGSFYKNKVTKLFGSYKGQDIDYTNEHSYFDIGASYFKKMNDYISFEVLSGFGIGKLKYTNYPENKNDYTFNLNAKKSNLYIQPVVTFSPLDEQYKRKLVLDFSLFSKLNRNHFYNIDKSIELGINSYINDVDQYFLNHNTINFHSLESGIQFRIGIKQIKFITMFSYTSMLDNKNINYQDFNSYIGLSTSFYIR